MRLPEALPAKRTALLIGLKQRHQADFDAWRPILAELAADPELDWLELPFVPVGAILRGIISGAMDRKLTDPVLREHFAPVWGSAELLKEAVGIESDAEMVLLVVGGTGEVLWRRDGGPGARGAAELTTWLAYPEVKPSGE